MLHIVAKNDFVQRIDVARRHIETAIAHINDVAQTRVLEQSASIRRRRTATHRASAGGHPRSASQPRMVTVDRPGAPQAKPAMLLD